MSFSAWKGPLLGFLRARPALSPSGAGALDYNENGPSPAGLFEYGFAMPEARQPFCYQPAMSGPFYGHVTQGPIVDQVPSTLEANNIAASQVPVAGTPLTLVTSSGAGITVGASVVNALTGQLVTGLLAIDGAMGNVPFGTANNLTFGGANWFTAWDPTKAISRAVRIHSVGNDSAATFLVSGYDIYGYPMTQLVTGGSGADADTLKAFKYIASVLPEGTLSGSDVTVGTTDIYGFPLYVPAWAYCEVYWNSALITSSSGFTAADATSPATNLTGDVRGTYYVGSGTPSNGTISLQMIWRPQVAGLAAGETGVYGQQQV